MWSQVFDPRFRGDDVMRGPIMIIGSGAPQSCVPQKYAQRLGAWVHLEQLGAYLAKEYLFNYM